MLPFLFLACASGPNNPTSPISVDAIALFSDLDLSAIQLDLAKAKKEYSIGKVKTIKYWSVGESEEGEISYLPLMKGEKMVGILDTVTGEADRDDMKNRAKSELDSLFSVSGGGDPMELLSQKGYAGGIVGVSLDRCISDTLANMQSIMIKLSTKECEAFTSPNEEWYKYNQEEIVSSLNKQIDRLDEEDGSFAEETKEDLSDYKKFIEKMDVQKYIEMNLYRYPDVNCVQAELFENEEYVYLNGAERISSLCDEYISYLAEFQK